MSENYQICPYTGLRSFTEEEALYFKGRDEDIDLATSQLERNKFLMLTGASGDGKSSLIYAGIIPNARAGFLKSKYSQWCVADFRPERTPFLNLCRSVAKQLGILQVQTVQAELSHGFSALIDLYKSSKRYIDTNSEVWKETDESGRAAMKREAANLILLVDQFEEFFTNPENYLNGAPSNDSSLVLNLLLETARIALDEDLPVYVVFTMRSDYIGQCAAFHGLPEYLGFSQYFVPRMNRAQLQQVIEEPAILNGNRITRRLTERLIHDVTEGVDQLPILQHTLSQIWIAAENGADEMDLVHYAMVGGLRIDDIPDEDIKQFESWFNHLPASIRMCYHAPTLQNVLDTHCNKLYEEAAEYYRQHSGKAIGEEQAKQVIRAVFSCLTKLDQGRAVRNRMSAEEIRDIINDPLTDIAAITGIINIYREPGNTFIHPFINPDEKDSRSLRENEVLDITHESLIRNWQYLRNWAKSESENHAVYLDFEQQLKRWIESNRSGNFLLSLGQLTYFEQWFKNAKPNKYWIARYLREDRPSAEKLSQASKILEDSNEFLNRSNKKYALTRKLMKFGPKRIAAAAAVLIVLLLSSFAVNGYYKKRNSQVLAGVHDKIIKLIGSKRATLESKSLVIGESLRTGLFTIDEVAASIKQPLARLNQLIGISAHLVVQGHAEPQDEIYRALFLSDSLLATMSYKGKNASEITAVVKEMADLRITLELGYSYNPSPAIDSLRDRHARRCAVWAAAIITDQPAGYKDILTLTQVLEYAVSQRAYSRDEINQLIKQLSPFENGLNTEWLKETFNVDNFMMRGVIGHGFPFNGLYQQLAYLYAAAGDNKHVSMCTDSLLLHNEYYFQNDYATNADNAISIAIVFGNYGLSEKLDSFVNYYCRAKAVTPVRFYETIIARAIPNMYTNMNIDMFFWSGSYNNINQHFLSRALIRFILNKQREAIEKNSAGDEKNYLLALNYKNEGILLSLNQEKQAPGEPSIESIFDEAIRYYSLASESYKHQLSTSIGNMGIDVWQVQRNYLFLFPDYRSSFHPNEPRSTYFFYSGSSFMDYLLKKDLINKLYQSPEELESITQWLYNYNAKLFASYMFMARPLNVSTLKNLSDQLDKNPDKGNVDFGLLYLYGGMEAQKTGDTALMLSMYDKLQLKNLLNHVRTKDQLGNVANQAFRTVVHAVKGYAVTGHMDKAFAIVDIFKNPINRSSLYAYAADQLQQTKYKGPVVQQLIDSAMVEMDRSDVTTQDQPNREGIATALAYQMKKGNIDEAYRVIRNISIKLATIRMMAQAFAFNDRVYMAEQQQPGFAGDSDLNYFYTNLLLGYNNGRTDIDPKWKFYVESYPNADIFPLKYIDEN